MAVTKKLRVLVIDDESTQRMLVKDYLESAGHEVIVSEDGKRGLKLAGSSKPDIILLDFLLPGLDGCAVCRKLKENPATASIPVVLVTASRETDVIDKGLAAGAEDFITKPVDWEYLPDRVVHVVRKSAERFELTRQLQSQNKAGARPVQAATSGAAVANGPTDLDDLLSSADLYNDQRAAEKLAREKEIEAEVAKRVANELAEAHAQLDAKLAAERAHAESEMSEVVQLINAEWTLKLEKVAASIRDESAVEMQRLRAQAELEKNVLRAEFERIKSDSSELDKAAARLDAVWHIAARTASSLYTLAASLEHKASQNTQGSDSMADIHRSAKALKNISMNFKTMSDAMSVGGNSADTVKPVSIIDDIVQRSSHVAASRRIVIQSHKVDPAIEVTGDANRIRLAVTNLVTNALKNTPPGGTIDLSAYTDVDGSIRIGVEDNGVGIAPAKLQELALCLDQPMTQSQASSSDYLGLGIPAAQAIARSMSGTIELKSRLGVGTHAEIVFPCQKKRFSTKSKRVAA